MTTTLPVTATDPYPGTAIRTAYRYAFRDLVFDQALTARSKGATPDDMRRTWWNRNHSKAMRHHLRRMAWREVARDFGADLAQTIADDGDDWTRAYNLNGYRAAKARETHWAAQQ